MSFIVRVVVSRLLVVCVVFVFIVLSLVSIIVNEFVNLIRVVIMFVRIGWESGVVVGMVLRLLWRLVGIFGEI